MEPTIIFINGNIITMNEAVKAEAVAVANDRIAAVGTRDEIMEMSNVMTTIVDLKTRPRTCRAFLPV